MAKDNLFLGFGRGKVGDVVFYRRDGQQITRARNRAPRNPNTFRQQVQRSVSANCQRLYSAGMQVFNHSFEGLKVGEGCQREFLRLNMKKLRSLIINDYNLGRSDADCIGRVGAPGLTIPVPFDGMVISNGSVQQSVFSFDMTEGFSLPEPLRNAQDAINETVGHYCLRVGLVPEDIYSFVAFGCDPVEGTELAYYGDIANYTPYAAIFTMLFAYSQLRVKAGVTEDETPMTSSTTLAAFFEAGEVGNDITGNNFVNPISPQHIDLRLVDGLIGCIRSREDSGVRSPSMLQKMASGNSFGLTANYLEKAWGERARIAGSDLILEGSDFTPTGGGNSSAPYAATTSGGTSVTLIGVKNIMGVLQAASGTYEHNVVVAFDEQGNNYLIKNVDTESRSYGMYLTEKDDVEPWRVVATPAPTNNNTVEVERDTNEGSFWNWLMTQGVTWAVWVELP